MVNPRKSQRGDHRRAGALPRFTRSMETDDFEHVVYAHIALIETPTVAVTLMGRALVRWVPNAFSPDFWYPIPYCLFCVVWLAPKLPWRRL
jgi:hypothetical protein